MPRRAVMMPPTSGVHVSGSVCQCGDDTSTPAHPLFRLNDPMRIENCTLSEPSSRLSEVLSGPRRYVP